jgi:hypothetical protein
MHSKTGSKHPITFKLICHDIMYHALHFTLFIAYKTYHQTFLTVLHALVFFYALKDRE